MALPSVADLVADPTLGLRLVAGAAGQEREIRWVHVSEIPDPTAWLDGGEVLLTTGLALQESEDVQRHFVRQLVACGCVGIGFGLDVWTDAVPAAMVAEADAVGLPIFTVPYEVPFVAIARRVAHDVFSDHYGTLQAAVDLHQHVAAAVLGGRGLDAVIAALSRRLPDQDIVVFGYHGDVLATRPSGAGATSLDPAAVWAAITPAWRHDGHLGVAMDPHHIHATRVRIEGEVEAVLALVGGRPITDAEDLLLTQGLTGVGLELARSHSLRESRRLQLEVLLDEVREGMLSAPALVRRLERFGIADGPLRILAVRRADGSEAPRLAAFVEDVLGAMPATSVVGRLEGVIHAIASAPADDTGDALARAATARGWHEVVVGVSREKPDLAGLRSALAESRRAVVAAAGQHVSAPVVVDIGSLGVDGLVAGFDSDVELEAFVHQVLGPLLAHEERESLPLLDTLRAYLAHGCRPGPAAAELCIHRHTLTYRLDRIASLTGRNLRDGDDLLALGFALRVLSRLTDS